MNFEKTGGVGGAWVKASEVVSGTPVKLITEATESDSEFGKQVTAKARFKGAEEAVNIRINKPTLNGLIDAFGKDSKEWIGKVMTAITEKAIVGGKRVTIMYLVPENFELAEDEGGYMIVKPKVAGETPRTRSKEEVEEDIDLSAVPF
jgi:hypothetical protein